MKKRVNERKQTSQKFVVALAIVSIAGFLSIAVETIFDFSLDVYLDFVLMLVVGFGILADTDFKALKSLRRGLNPKSFTNLVVVIIGALAVIAGIFSLPQIAVEHPMFLSIKGIIAIIAIVVIIVQTWFSREL